MKKPRDLPTRDLFAPNVPNVPIAGPAFDQTANPYQATGTTAAPADVRSEIEQMRAIHINHEVTLKQLGGIIALAGFCMLVGAFMIFSAGQSGFSATGSTNWVYIITLGIFGLAMIAGGFGMRMLWQQGQHLCGIVATAGLFFFPIGTVIGAFVLFALYCPKGRTVFRPEYREVIALTPHIGPKTHPVTYLVFFAFLSFVGYVIYRIAFQTPI